MTGGNDCSESSSSNGIITVCALRLLEARQHDGLEGGIEYRLIPLVGVYRIVRIHLLEERLDRYPVQAICQVPDKALTASIDGWG
jgi:hypothetical protein